MRCKRSGNGVNLRNSARCKLGLSRFFEQQTGCLCQHWGYGCPSNAGEKNSLNANSYGYTLKLTPLPERLQTKTTAVLSGLKPYQSRWGFVRDHQRL